MNNVTSWIKANPVSVIAIAVVIVSFGFMGWLWSAQNQLKAEAAARMTKLRELSSLTHHAIEIPSKDPDAPPNSLVTTITQRKNAQISDIFKRMTREQQGITEYRNAVNRKGHEPLVADLFPHPADASLQPFHARARYRESFTQMLRPYQPDAALPRLDAGMPPSMDTLQTDLDALSHDFTSTAGVAGMDHNGQASLTPQEQKKLTQKARNRLLELLRSRAEKIHIYADTRINSSAFPFQVDGWSMDRTHAPRMYQLWEGQLELWIQQDIAEAIALTNHTDDPKSNVLNAPVKRLIAIEVLPGYVGLQTLGGLANGAKSIALTGGFSDVQGSGNNARGNRSSNAGVTAAYPPPAGGLTGNGKQPVSNNFYVGASGRVSNALYDVRQARLIVDVDARQLPKLLRNISRVNFMTVLNCQMHDVDEYAALQHGYVYTGDVVRVEVLIETIWFRDWTSKLMPSLVRQSVGIDKPATAVGPTGPAMPGSRMPGRSSY